MVELYQQWTQAYLQVKRQWKFEPNWKLIEYLHLIPHGPVLDLGAGNGRNALFFAKLGHEVDYVDVSKTYSKRVKARADDENLKHTRRLHELEQVEENTYYHRKYRQHFHYFTRDELLSLFPQLRTIIYNEGTALDLKKRNSRYYYTLEYLGQHVHAPPH